MFYSSIIILVIVANLSFSAANAGRNPILPLNSNYAMPEDVINVGNGVNRNNVVVLDERTNSGSPRAPNNGLGNRFGAEPTYNANQPSQGPTRTSTPWQGSVTNIGNGYQNRNTVVTVDSNHRTISAQNANGRSNSGTSFVAQRGNREDLYNVGYGPGNTNQILVNGRPVQPDQTNSRGTTQHVQSENTAGEANRQSVEIEGQLKTLYSLSQQLEQISARLIQEAAKLNIRL